MAALCYTFLESDAPSATDEQYVAAIQDRIKRETAQSAGELNQIRAIVTAAPTYSFRELRRPTAHPYYIFRNKALLFWSDDRFVPDYGRMASVITPRLIDFDQGRYIVNRTRVYRNRDTLDIFSLIMVYEQHSNSNEYIRSGYNPALFSLDPAALITQKGPAYQNVYDATPVFLFSVKPPVVDPFRNRTTPVNTIILASLAILFLGLYVIRQLIQAARQRLYEVGFGWLAGYLIVLRGAMLYLSVPYLFYENDLFSPKNYASSELAPSLGDLMLNGIALMLLGFYVVNNFFRSRTYQGLLRLPRWVRSVLSVGLVMLSYVVYYLCFNQLNDLYDKSQYTLDLALGLTFPPLKAASLVFFLILSVVYFLAQHVLVSVFIRFNRGWLPGLGLFAAGTLLTFGLCWLLVISQRPEPLYLLNSGYFLALYLSLFPRYLYRFQYKTSLYFFLCSFVCAFTAASVVHRQNTREDLLNKSELGEHLLAENDEYGEYLLLKAQTSINNDPDIRRSFLLDTLWGRRERIQTRFKTLYLDKYFDKYDTEVSSYDAGGIPLDASDKPVSLTSYVERFQQPQHKTRYGNLYFINEIDNQFIKEYVDFIDIRDAGGGIIGYVVLDLKLRKETPSSVYPTLLIDDKLVQSPKLQKYSHAVYERLPGAANLRLLSNAGTYNYERRMPAAMLAEPALYERGIALENFTHFGMRGTNGRVVVVSSLERPFGETFATFSFLYLILVLSVIVVIMLYSLQYGFSRFNLNLSTKIQILLNLAFFVPLVAVVTIILGVINSNYVTSQEATYLGSTRNIAVNLQTYLDEHVRKVRSRESMEEELETIARAADTDINLFDVRGRLYSTTSKLMYESGHLSPYMNPFAYIHIAEDRENQILLAESLGTKQFSQAYVGVKSETGRLLGIISVPYFYAQTELDRQMLEVVASALSVFTSLFLVFLILSYLASESIIRPLRLITQQMRRTSLDQLNQTIDWRSDDEVGTLVKEYNRMLRKLEESKVSLAQSEKQSAWREMAKQVAHEIKNPLTPMKLTLQQLQRTLPGNNPVTDRAVNRTLNSLLDQIDNISDIATSFSDFANMPVPQNEVVELTSLVHKAADLYADDDKVTISRQIAIGPVLVTGDRQMLMRIMTNLIINGIQSVKPGERPAINLRLSATNDAASIEVHDNGQGIPEGIQTKVFLPNFSTKQGGNGIGLALSKRGIEHAGGSIWFETAVGVGTSFFIALPLAHPEQKSHPQAQKATVNGSKLKRR